MIDNKELLERLVRIARAEVGVREQGTNSGARVVEYQAKTWLKPGSWPWCAAFACWVLAEWLRSDDVLAALGIPKARVNNWRCRDASAWGWETWGKAAGLQILPETAQPRPGDFVLYDFSHIGIVVSPTGLNTFDAIEGNTGPGGGREGDGVYLKHRSNSVVRCFVRVLP